MPEKESSFKVILKGSLKVALEREGRITWIDTGTSRDLKYILLKLGITK